VTRSVNSSQAHGWANFFKYSYAPERRLISYKDVDKSLYAEIARQRNTSRQAVGIARRRAGLKPSKRLKRQLTK